MSPINLYSAALLFIFIILLAGFVLLRKGASRGRVALLVLIGLGLVAGWWLVRPQQTPHADTAALQGQIGAGKPVLLEFQSPY
jgi:hypothetical protein